MSQFILIGAVFNKMRLGTPHDEGVVPAAPSDSRAHKDPATAIDEEKRKTPEGRDTASVLRRTDVSEQRW